MKKIKNIVFVLSTVLLLSGATYALNSSSIAHAEETATSEVVNQEDLRQVNAAKDNLYLNIDLDNVVSDKVYLPSRGLYGAQITWQSGTYKYLSHDGTVKRPSETEGPQTVTLTATLVVRTATTTKEFTLRILPKKTHTIERSIKFDENFSTYKTGLDLSNYYLWELKNGDEIAKIRESVENNNMIKVDESDKVLEIQPLETLYKDSIYQRKINLPETAILETYVMTSGESSGFKLELGPNGSTRLEIGMINGNFVTGKDSYDASGKQTSSATLTPYDDGVWYKLRVEVNVKNQTFHAYYYDYNNNGALKEITKSSGESCKGLTQGTDNYFRMRVLTGRHNCKIYVSNIHINDTIEKNAGVNPNRERGIGVIDNFTSSYLLVENQAFTLPELVIHNRFGKKQVLSENIDYTLTKNWKDNKVLNPSQLVQGNYEVTYTITLNVSEDIKETKILTQKFYVDDKDATAQLDTLRIAPIVKDTDSTYVDKKVRISANINRIDSTVYYSAVEAGSKTLTKDDITNSKGIINGSLKVENASFEIVIEGLDKNKEYDFFVVTKNNNGVSEIYKKEKVSVSVYNIEDNNDFFFMCTDPEVQTTNFRLLTDLDFADYYWAASEITRPNYVGTFDGLGHTISNLHISAPYKKASLFYNFAGTFENLTFKDCLLEGHESVGFIGGYGAGNAHVNNVKMINCTVRCDDDTNAGDAYYGLIFGRAEGGSSNQGNALIENVEAINCTVNGPKYVGALVGNLQKMSSLTLKNINISVDMKSDGAALGLVSRARSPLNIYNVVADVHIRYAKKQVAVLCGELVSQAYAENVVGKLTIDGLTQPTYYNNVTGNYSKAEGTKFTYKDLYFFTVDTSNMSEDAVVPVTSSLNAGITINEEPGDTKMWWEQNTWLVDLDTNANWKFDDTTKRPMLFNRDLTNLSFTASEINTYIDAIGDKISSDSLYYIRKAHELIPYCVKGEENQIHKDKLAAAEKAYKEYYDNINSVIGSFEEITSATTGGIDWTFEKKENN